MSVRDRVNGWARRVPIWAVYLIYSAPIPWLLWLAQTGGLGIEPITALEHELGEIALQLMIIGLCITPLRRFLGINLLRLRRAIGLLAFLYVVLHLSVWLFLDVGDLGRVVQDVFKRPYITIGMLAFVLMIPLAVTSNNASLRRLGVVWRKIHRLTYAAAILGAVHYVMLGKVWEVESLAYLSVIVILLALRLPANAVWRLRQRVGFLQTGR